MSGPSKGEEVAVLLKSIKLLLCLAEEPMSVVELSNKTGISKPTTYRIINTLQLGGFVVRHQKRRKYALGPVLIGLGRATYDFTELIRLARPSLRQLHNKYHQTVNLGVLNHRKVIYIDTLETREMFQVTTPVNLVENCCTTAAGRTILAAMPVEDVRQMIGQMALPKKINGEAITLDQFLESIREYKTLGYAIDNEEDKVGFRCVAAPILDSSNYPIAAISLTTLTKQGSVEDFAIIGQSLIAVCTSLAKLIPMI